MNERRCCICSQSLEGKRSHAKTCSLNCRMKLSASARKGGVLVNLRLPLDKYTRFTIEAMRKGKSVNDLICDQLRKADGSYLNKAA